MQLTDAQKAKGKAQVEFYFSDSNLPNDGFLRNKVREDADGFVPIALICSFSKMRAILGIPDDKKDAVPKYAVEDLAEELKDCADLEVSEDNARVRRKSPIPDPKEAAQMIDARSLALQPFPFDATLDDITDFLSGHGRVMSVRMIRHTNETKLFKGKVFAEFESVEVANAVAAKELTFAGATLRVQPKVDYLKDHPDDANVGPESTPGREEKRRRESVASGEKRRRESGAIGHGGRGGRGRDGAADEEGGGAERAKRTRTEDAVPEVEAGSVVRFEFVGEVPDHGPGRQDLRSALGGNDVAFVEYKFGEAMGYVRFSDAAAAARALERGTEVDVAEGDGVTHKIKLELIGKEEFDKYVERIGKPGQGGRDRRGGGGGRGGRRGGRGGRGGGGRGRN